MMYIVPKTFNVPCFTAKNGPLAVSRVTMLLDKR